MRERRVGTGGWRKGQRQRQGPRGAILSAGARRASRGPSPLYGRSGGEGAAPALKMAAPAVLPLCWKPALCGLPLSSPVLGAGELHCRVPGPPSPECFYSFSSFSFYWKGAVLREGAVRTAARVAEVLHREGTCPALCLESPPVGLVQ